MTPGQPGTAGEPEMPDVPDAARRALVAAGALVAERGLAPGSSGNLSVRVPGGYLLTPTGSRLGALDGARLSVLDRNGTHLGGDPPTKEVPIHLAIYAQRPAAGAVVHLHSTYATAVSCLDGLDPDDALPPLTAYQVMRLGRLALVGYHPPGDGALGAAVARVAADHSAVLLANHGSVLAAATLREAVAAAEELEQAARLHLVLAGHPVRLLTDAQVDAVRPPA